MEIEKTCDKKCEEKKFAIWQDKRRKRALQQMMIARQAAAMGGMVGRDITGPTVDITANADTITSAPFTATITFTNPETGLPEEVTGFALGDITVSANAGAGAFANPSTGVYTAVITPTASGSVTVDVLAGVGTDAANNPNTAATQFSIVAIVFTLQDEFTTNDAAPIDSPRTSEPGPGTLTVVDAAASISSGVLTFASANQPIGSANTVTRLSGRTAILKPINFGSSFGGWFKTVTNGQHWQVLRPGTGLYRDGGATIIDVGTISTSVPWFFVQRSTGLFVVVNDKLMWVNDDDTFATMTPAVIRLGDTTSLEFMRVADFPSPWNDDYGVATQRLAGARTAGDTFTHVADCLIELLVTTRPSSGNVDFRFRQQNPSNYWQVTIDSTGAFTLNEIVNDTPTQRATAAAVVSNGHRVMIIADGQTIKGYSNNTLRWTYASATNFASAVDGKLSDEGTSGDIREIISWPRYFVGSALNVLSVAGGANP